MTKEQLAQLKESNGGNLPSYGWPGGYPIYYLMDDGGTLCPTCANDPTNPIHLEGESFYRDVPKDGWGIVAYDINWEDSSLYCAHCNKRIESAYAEDSQHKETCSDCDMPEGEHQTDCPQRKGDSNATTQNG